MLLKETSSSGYNFELIFYKVTVNRTMINEKDVMFILWLPRAYNEEDDRLLNN